MRSILAFLFCLVPALTIAQPNLTDSLIFFYEFDSNATDLSGNQLDANVNGAIGAADRDGVTGGALYFDGVDDYIQLPSSNLIEQDFPVTFSFWLKPDNLDYLDGAIIATDFDLQNYAGFFISTTVDNSGRISVNVGGNNGGAGTGSRRSKASNSSLTAGVWQQVSVVLRSATDIDIYIDCQNAGGSYSGSGPTAVGYTSIDGRIGSRPDNGVTATYYYQGAIDDFAFWNRELSISEIADVCQGNLLSTDDEDITNEATTGISIYPNPMEDFTMVDFGTNNDFSSNCMIEVYDAAGKLVRSEQKGNFQVVQLSRAGLEGGIYTIVVSDNEVRTLAGKLIVQ